MPNKQAHNAFYYFMLDVKKQQGRQFKSMSEVSQHAGPLWTNLPKEKRRYYEDLAKSRKGDAKLNSDGVPVDVVGLEERQDMEFKQHMKDEIHAALMFAKRSNTLESQLFFIIHMNSFCQHEHSKEYYPCEIAIAGFSLSEGVPSHNVYHSMIKPGRLPLGYVGIAQQHSNATHQIEVPMVGDVVEDNQEEVFCEVMEFLSSMKKGSSDRFPILYAAEKDVPMIKKVLHSWCDHFNVDPDSFQVFNLQCLFRILRNMVAETDCWTSDTMSYQEIEKDVYNYAPNIACEFHEISEVLVCCSRSIVVRYAYIICDNCCKDAGIELIPGLHVPKNSIIPDFKTVRSDTKSRKAVSSKNMSDASVREDSTDADSTIMSLGRSTVSERSASSASINFSELNIRDSNRSRGTTSTKSNNSTISNSGCTGSYAGATSSRAGISGFSRRPYSEPFHLSDELGAISVNEDLMDSHFPKIGGGGRGRGNPIPNRGKGRGNPFKKSS